MQQICHGKSGVLYITDERKWWLHTQLEFHLLEACHTEPSCSPVVKKIYSAELESRSKGAEVCLWGGGRFRRLECNFKYFNCVDDKISCMLNNS